MAHTAEGAAKLGVDQRKLDAVWSYQTSPLFSAAERAALDLAVAAGCVPNAVTDEMFMELRKHWSDEQVVEIVGVIVMFGFLNRWNETFATPLGEGPLECGEKHLARQGWDAGKHLRCARASIERAAEPGHSTSTASSMRPANRSGFEANAMSRREHGTRRI